MRSVFQRVENVMKNSFLLTVLLLLPCAAQAQKAPKVTLSSTSTVAASDIRKGFRKKCPNVSLTLEPGKADYALEAIAEPINLISGSPTTRYRFTLFSRSGNIIYSTSPHKFSNAINNVCMAINKQEPGSSTSLPD